jgi:uncharacterized protein (DUF2236 family)
MVAIPQENRFYFAPDSAIWQINRERVLQLTGARVLLMQIAHPLIAEAVYQHSYVFQKPLLRLHRTLRLTLDMVFGSREEVQKAVADIEAAHRPAKGRLAEGIGKHETGTVYNARNPRQGLWVFSTLVEGSVSGYERLVAPLSTAEKNEFLGNSAQIAEWMQIPQSMIPATYSDLLAYIDEAISSKEVIVGDSACKIAPFITAQSNLLLKIPSYPLIRFNIALLPAAIREQYGYTLANWELALAEEGSRLSRVMQPFVPKFLRYAPEYQRAMQLLTELR